MKTLLMAAALALLAALPQGAAQAEDKTPAKAEQSKAEQSQPAAAEMTPEERARFEAVIREYLLENPEIIIQSLEEYQRRERAAQAERQQQRIKSLQGALFENPDHPVMGNPEGSVAMVEFFDYNCGYCKRSLEDVVALTEANPELKVVMFEYPILHPTSETGARAALAAAGQGKYVEFHTALMSQPGRFDEARIMEIAEKVGLDTARLKADMESEAIARQIEANRSLARALGVEGTPAFIIGEELIPGAVGRERLQTALDALEKG